MLFFDTLLCIDFSSINKVAYDCFQTFFIYLNIQFGQVIKSQYDSNLEVYNTKLIGIEALWEIVLLSKKEEVYQASSKFLHQLFKSLSPDLQENLKEIKEEFLAICMENIEIGVLELKSNAEGANKENA